MLEEISWYFPLSALLNAVTSTVLGFYIIFTNFKKTGSALLVFILSGRGLLEL